MLSSGGLLECCLSSPVGRRSHRGRRDRLAGALRTLDDRIDRTPTRDLREAASVSSLSILPLEPVAVDSDDPSLLDRLRARLFRTHPPTERRLAVLEELELERERERR